MKFFENPKKIRRRSLHFRAISLPVRSSGSKDFCRQPHRDHTMSCHSIFEEFCRIFSPKAVFASCCFDRDPLLARSTGRAVPPSLEVRPQPRFVRGSNPISEKGYFHSLVSVVPFSSSSRIQNLPRPTFVLTVRKK